MHGIARLPPSPPVEPHVDAVGVLDFLSPLVDEVDAELGVERGAAVLARVVALPERACPAAFEVNRHVEKIAPIFVIHRYASQSPVLGKSVCIQHDQVMGS